MKTIDTAKFAELSPFELKDKLIAIASSDSERMMLNAGRGNPNFLATLPRRAFMRLGEFALSESERSYAFLDEGFGGLPEPEGIVQRFEAFAAGHADTRGIGFLRRALSFVRDQHGIDRDAFLHEMVAAYLGCVYPVPPRMLRNAETIVAAYLGQEMYGPRPRSGPFSLFATEGGTAAMSYIFHSLQANRLMAPGDRVALGTPIFAPYLEIPPLPEFGLEVVDVRMDPDADWQFSDAELAKLEDPAIKALCLVNPSNPPSAKLTDDTLDRLADLIETKRPDLMIVTDDVYGTFADDFVSIFAACPRNTLCVYSFSKYFGATGWRLGVIGLHEDNVFDDTLSALAEADKARLDTRYQSLTTEPRRLRFIDRLVADSRAVALNHTAGLSTPQQAQMTLFALHGLMDRDHGYKNAAKRLIRDRFRTLYSEMGMEVVRQDAEVNYYSLIDLQRLAGQLFGDAFSDWFVKQNLGTDFLFRLADETGVVLLPGKGFEVVEASARVSLANLREVDYAAIGRFTRKVLDEYHADFLAQT